MALGLPPGEAYTQGEMSAELVLMDAGMIRKLKFDSGDMGLALVLRLENL
jgi:hypothetical protein